MDEKELRWLELSEIEWGVGEDGYRDAVNYVQGVVTMVRAFDEILNE